jgi:hypothetical protein
MRSKLLYKINYIHLVVLFSATVRYNETKYFGMKVGKCLEFSERLTTRGPVPCVLIEDSPVVDQRFSLKNTERVSSRI